mmetsp:Transcript_37752/g.150505  ORF Transcript_37752/g.150505 Transcript_37752/m.150505 type:complete len:179 (+) Transcript_37752:878-1414(+)
MCKRSWSLQRGKLRSTYRSKALQEARTQSNTVCVRNTGGLGLSQNFDVAVGSDQVLQALNFQQPLELVEESLADSPTVLPAKEQTPCGSLIAQEGAETEPSEFRSQCLLPAQSGALGAGYGSERYFLSPEPQTDLVQSFQSPRYTILTAISTRFFNSTHCVKSPACDRSWLRSVALQL